MTTTTTTTTTITMPTPTNHNDNDNDSDEDNNASPTPAHPSLPPLSLRPPSPLTLALKIVQEHVYSSLKPEAETTFCPRKEMFDVLRDLHFDVHLGEFTGAQANTCIPIQISDPSQRGRMGAARAHL